MRAPIKLSTHFPDEQLTPVLTDSPERLLDRCGGVVAGRMSGAHGTRSERRHNCLSFSNLPCLGQVRIDLNINADIDQDRPRAALRYRSATYKEVCLHVHFLFCRCVRLMRSCSAVLRRSNGSSDRQCGNASLNSFLPGTYGTINLPRQPRDKHNESLKNRAFLAGFPHCPRRLATPPT